MVSVLDLSKFILDLSLFSMGIVLRNEITTFLFMYKKAIFSGVELRPISPSRSTNKMHQTIDPMRVVNLHVVQYLLQLNKILPVKDEIKDGPTQQFFFSKRS